MKRVIHLTLFLILLLVVHGSALAQDETSDLLGRINALRSSVGRAPYSLNGALTAAAQDQARWMVDTGSISHTRPDGSGPRTRALTYGYPTTDVSENIYGGSNATVGDAWTFWVNSNIHYRGLVNDRYQEIGIGIARGSWGTTFVLVFGNPGGPPPAPPASSGGGSGSSAAPPAPPSYVVGSDEFGNILHEIQPGDTLGDIALIYGYVWDDIPAIMQLNGMADVRDLEVGMILKIPPQGGTYTPTPGGEPTATATAEFPTPFPEDPIFALLAATPTASPTTPAIATAAAVPASFLIESPTPSLTPTLQSTEVALVPTMAPALSATQQGSGGPPLWLLIGIGVQMLVIVGAGFEFLRRNRRK